jgi:outer membrane lipoprotein-sorting protein
MKLYSLFFFVLIGGLAPLLSQTAEEIITRADEAFRGNSAYIEMSIKTVRPKWTKEIQMKTWSQGANRSVSVVLSPAKEKGTVFLMRDQEVWNYIPSLDRSIKFPPSMMLQNWMGTDLTNDDLVKKSSLQTDYNKKIVGEDRKENLRCWKIELIPRESASVVWGKIVVWIDQQNYMQLQTDFYDEDGFLVNQMTASNFKTFGGKTLPATLRVVPVEKDNQYTEINYSVWEFDLVIPESYFETNTMKRIR